MNYLGKIYNKLTVLEIVRRDKYWQKIVLAKCECGTIKEYKLGNLRSGNTKSCGCLTQGTSNHKTHGMTNTITYSTWNSMLTRCTNPNSASYINYGGRGIKVCKRWYKFENFLEDMGIKPEGLTLERIDNDGDYTPENCKWANKSEQANNRSTARLITYNGQTKSLIDWSKTLNINYAVLRQRLYRGWTIEQSFR